MAISNGVSVSMAKMIAAREKAAIGENKDIRFP